MRDVHGCSREGGEGTSSFSGLVHCHATLDWTLFRHSRFFFLLITCILSLFCFSFFSFSPSPSLLLVLINSIQAYLFHKITSHLNHTDLPPCSLVNRYRNSRFGPLVWHTLTFSEDLYSEDPFHKNHRAIFNWKGLFIRQLYSHDCRSLVFFNGPQSRCRYLEELKFTACLAHKSTTQAVQLIRDNLQLERLTILWDFTLTQSIEVPQNLFSALLQYPTLTQLQLGNIDTTIDYLYVRALLAHLPPTLQSLVVSWTSITNLDPDQVSASDPSWPTAYPRLGHLSINTKFMDQTHEHLLFPFCPVALNSRNCLSLTWMNGLHPPLPSPLFLPTIWLFSFATTVPRSVGCLSTIVKKASCWH